MTILEIKEYILYRQKRKTQSTEKEKRKHKKSYLIRNTTSINNKLIGELRIYAEAKSRSDEDLQIF